MTSSDSAVAFAEVQNRGQVALSTLISCFLQTMGSGSFNPDFWTLSPVFRAA